MSESFGVKEGVMKVREFSDGSYLEYAEGNFDQWCVYMVNPAKGFRRPPLDVDYFGFLQSQAKTFGAKRLYDDFVSIYDKTGKEIDVAVFKLIDLVALNYGTQALEFSKIFSILYIKIFSILYMGMLAEENKAYTRLGKRIKRLGMHKLLIENESVDTAANFMRKMKWYEIDALCRSRGF